jgi:membrane protease YdiL (CAAX protease family)
MTAAFSRPSSAIVRPGLIIGGLGALVGLRWIATLGSTADGRVIGLAFGLAMFALAGLCGWRPATGRPSSLAVPLGVGAAGGAALVVLALATRQDPLPSLAPPGPFGPWAAATVLVATAEEVVLRGVLFDTIDRRLGVVAAILATSLVFALMHVPLYGWHVVPLDLGVGLWLAGLRLGTGGTVAPAIAHTMADLATWWL